MAFDTTQLLDLLATRMATTAGINYASDSSPRALWVLMADEDQSAEAYAVLRPYGGETSRLGKSVLPVQCRAIAREAKNAMDFCSQLHRSLCDANGAPLHSFVLGTYRVQTIQPLGIPALLSAEGKRAEAVFNFDLHVTPTAA